MKILFLRRDNKYGGNVYESMVEKFLSEKFDVQSEVFSSKKDFLLNAWKVNARKDVDVVIRNLDFSLFSNKYPVKNVAIVHHIDYSFAPFLIKTIFSFLLPTILRRLRKFDKIVVVSKYWENFFRKRGYNNVHLIYNAFNLGDFNISDKEVLDFKRRHKLESKPIIYLGNCQKAKGVVQSYNALKDLDVYFVTSGEKTVSIPAINLNLSYREYLILLKASSIVVTMSQFKEGWNRTAHEAMLVKTPVIGSGKGGMRELLEGGKQVVCPDFYSLREKVEYLLRHLEARKRMGEDGYNFAKNFTMEIFREKWLKLIKKLL